MNRSTYLDRMITKFGRRIAILEQKSKKVSSIRLVYAIVSILLVWFLSGYDFDQYNSGNIAFWSAFILLIGFNFLARIHRKIAKSLNRHQIYMQIQIENRARLHLDFDHIPFREGHVTPADHPFSDDLDLTGRQSLHHLIDTATTSGGSVVLHDLLLQPTPDFNQIEQNQALIRELAPMSRFRNKLLLFPREASAGNQSDWESSAILNWLEDQKEPPAALWFVILMSVLALTNIYLIFSHLAGTITGLWGYTTIAYVGLYFSRFRSLAKVLDDATTLEITLQKFTAVAQVIETYNFRGKGALKSLCSPFQDKDHRPSILLKRVKRIVAAAAMQRNELLMVLLNMFVPFQLIVANRLAGVKAQLQTDLPTWLKSWYKLESVASLATFAWLNPAYVYPTLAKGETMFSATNLGHPLIEPSARISNDFSMSPKNAPGLITGSNMSGKSTFLRTIGINLVLSFAGAPVCADKFSTGGFRIFSSMRVTDSIAEGFSFFYAEVRRLKALLDACTTSTDNTPVLYLVDEIFRGTNNRERLIGSRAYIRALAKTNAVGLFSTHDLELVQLENEIATLTNLHFRESVEDGKMVFDYKLHEGPCPTTNALKIMALAGLPVDIDQHE